MTRNEKRELLMDFMRFYLTGTVVDGTLLKYTPTETINKFLSTQQEGEEAKPSPSPERSAEEWTYIKDKFPEDGIEVLILTDETDQDKPHWIIASYEKAINKWTDNYDNEWPCYLISKWKYLSHSSRPSESENLSDAIDFGNHLKYHFVPMCNAIECWWEQEGDKIERKYSTEDVYNNWLSSKQKGEGKNNI